MVKKSEKLEVDDQGVFAGSEVPLQSLFDHLAAGGAIDAFVVKNPPVTREQVVGFLEFARSHWNAGGPDVFFLDPGPEIVAVYQEMCRQHSVAEYEEQLSLPKASF